MFYYQVDVIFLGQFPYIHCHFWHYGTPCSSYLAYVCQTGRVAPGDVMQKSTNLSRSPKVLGYWYGGSPPALTISRNLLVDPHWLPSQLRTRPSWNVLLSPGPCILLLLMAEGLTGAWSTIPQSTAGVRPAGSVLTVVLQTMALTSPWDVLIASAVFSCNTGVPGWTLVLFLRAGLSGPLSRETTLLHFLASAESETTDFLFCCPEETRSSYRANLHS